MANRREIKRNINGLLGDVIEECYSSLLNNEGKNEAQVEALIDECIDLADELIAKVNAGKNLKSRAEVKKMYAEVKEKLGDNVISYIEKLNSL